MTSLYRRFYTPEERALLDNTSPEDLSPEFELIRLLLADTLEAARQGPELSLRTHALILSAFTNAGFALAMMSRWQFRAKNLPDEFYRIWDLDWLPSPYESL